MVNSIFDKIVVLISVLIFTGVLTSVALAQSSSSDIVPAVVIVEPPLTGRININNAIIRESPDVNSRELARLPRGTIVTIVEQQGDWSKIMSPAIAPDGGWLLTSVPDGGWLLSFFVNTTPVSSSVQPLGADAPTAMPRSTLLSPATPTSSIVIPANLAATPTLTLTVTPTPTPTPRSLQESEVRVHHGKPGYTQEQVQRSYELNYVPPFVFGQGTQILYVQLAEMVIHKDSGVELTGGRLIAGIPFQVNNDGSVDDIIFHLPGGSIFMLQVGDQEGRHFDVSRYIPAPYTSGNNHVVVHAYRIPGGTWYYEMEGDFDITGSHDLIFMAEVASQYLAREIGGTVMQKSIARALARQERFGLWQRPDVKLPDGPWASQYMVVQCGQHMYYDTDVTPRFVQVTGTVSFDDLRTEDIFWNSLRSFPPPPNRFAKYQTWYCENTNSLWEPPAVK